MSGCPNARSTGSCWWKTSPADARLVREALAEHPAFSFQVAHFLQIELALKFLERDTVDVALLD